MPIVYVKGDATYPIGEGKKVIAHVCNNVGKWGKGFVLSIDKRWSEPKAQYKISEHVLYDTQFIQVEDDIFVANMVAMIGVWSVFNKKPLVLEALSYCLKNLYAFCKFNGFSVHMPKIGSGLAGGDWEVIEKIINDIFVNLEVKIYVKK